MSDTQSRELEYLYFNIYNLKRLKKSSLSLSSDIKILNRFKVLLKRYRDNIQYSFKRLDKLEVSYNIQNDLMNKANSDLYYNY